MIARRLAMAAAMLSAAPSVLAAQRGRADVEAGNRLYRDQRFEEAHQRYLDALREAPGSGLIRFNDGNALYKHDDYERAMEAYRVATQSGDPALQSQAWYNLGNALFRQQMLDGAADAYRESLRLNPADRDAKHNLERVLQVQQQQKQQNDRQQNDQSKDQRDQEQQPQDRDQQQPPDESPPQERPAQQDEHQQQTPGQQQEEQRQPQQGAQPEMTPEEAQQLLKAIQEDPGKIQRKHKTTIARRRPTKKW